MFEKEIERALSALDDAIQSAMETEVADAAKAAIADAVETEVYARYDPSEYVRRRDNGGLQDKDNMEDLYEPADRTLQVVNMTGDDEDGALVAEIVESGVGYHWEYSEIYDRQPFPRPFHKVAEQNMATTGAFERALKAGLARNGFSEK